MISIIDEMRDNRLKWLGHVLRRKDSERDRGNKTSKGNLCRREEEKRKTRTLVIRGYIVIWKGLA